MIRSRGRFRDWRHRPQAVFGRGSPSWQGRNRRFRSDICRPEWERIYKPLYHVAALQHARFIGPPESGVDDGGSITSKGGPDGDIAYGGGSAALEDDSCSGKENAEEGGVGPKSDGVAEA